MDEPKEQMSEDSEALVRPPVRKSTRKRSIMIFIVVSLLNVGLLTLLWTQLLTPASSSGSTRGTPSTAAANDPLLGAAAPNFALSTLAGQTSPTLSLADFKGHPVVINFWSSTCDPCKDEAPLLETQWLRTRGQGVIFLGIDVEDTRQDGLAFLQQHGVTYRNVIDTGGGTLVNYGVTYTPETIFIDRSGKVVSAVRMEITSQQLQAGLQQITR